MQTQDASAAVLPLVRLCRVGERLARRACRRGYAAFARRQGVLEPRVRTADAVPEGPVVVVRSVDCTLESQVLCGGHVALVTADVSVVQAAVRKLRRMFLTLFQSSHEAFILTVVWHEPSLPPAPSACDDDAPTPPVRPFSAKVRHFARVMKLPYSNDRTSVSASVFEANCSLLECATPGAVLGPSSRCASRLRRPAAYRDAYFKTHRHFDLRGLLSLLTKEAAAGRRDLPQTVSVAVDVTLSLDRVRDASWPIPSRVLENGDVAVGETAVLTQRGGVQGYYLDSLGGEGDGWSVALLHTGEGDAESLAASFVASRPEECAAQMVAGSPPPFYRRHRTPAETKAALLAAVLKEHPEAAAAAFSEAATAAEAAASKGESVTAASRRAAHDFISSRVVRGFGVRAGARIASLLHHPSSPEFRFVPSCRYNPSLLSSLLGGSPPQSLSEPDADAFLSDAIGLAFQGKGRDPTVSGDLLDLAKRKHRLLSSDAAVRFGVELFSEEGGRDDVVAELLGLREVVCPAGGDLCGEGYASECVRALCARLRKMSCAQGAEAAEILSEFCRSVAVVSSLAVDYGAVSREPARVAQLRGLKCIQYLAAHCEHFGSGAEGVLEAAFEIRRRVSCRAASGRAWSLGLAEDFVDVAPVSVREELSAELYLQWFNAAPAEVVREDPLVPRYLSGTSPSRLVPVNDACKLEALLHHLVTACKYDSRSLLLLFGESLARIPAAEVRMCLDTQSPVSRSFPFVPAFFAVLVRLRASELAGCSVSELLAGAEGVESILQDHRSGVYHVEAGRVIPAIAAVHVFLTGLATLTAADPDDTGMQLSKFILTEHTILKKLANSCDYRAVLVAKVFKIVGGCEEAAVAALAPLRLSQKLPIPPNHVRVNGFERPAAQLPIIPSFLDQPVKLLVYSGVKTAMENKDWEGLHRYAQTNVGGLMVLVSAFLDFYEVGRSNHLDGLYHHITTANPFNWGEAQMELLRFFAYPKRSVEALATHLGVTEQHYREFALDALLPNYSGHRDNAMFRHHVLLMAVLILGTGGAEPTNHFQQLMKAPEAPKRQNTYAFGDTLSDGTLIHGWDCGAACSSNHPNCPFRDTDRYASYYLVYCSLFVNALLFPSRIGEWYETAVTESAISDQVVRGAMRRVNPKKLREAGMVYLVLLQLQSHFGQLSQSLENVSTSPDVITALLRMVMEESATCKKSSALYRDSATRKKAETEFCKYVAGAEAKAPGLQGKWMKIKRDAQEGGTTMGLQMERLVVGMAKQAASATPVLDAGWTLSGRLREGGELQQTLHLLACLPDIITLYSLISRRAACLSSEELVGGAGGHPEVLGKLLTGGEEEHGIAAHNRAVDLFGAAVEVECQHREVVSKISRDTAVMQLVSTRDRDAVEDGLLVSMVRSILKKVNQLRAEVTDYFRTENYLFLECAGADEWLPPAREGDRSAGGALGWAASLKAGILGSQFGRGVGVAADYAMLGAATRPCRRVLARHLLLEVAAPLWLCRFAADDICRPLALKAARPPSKAPHAMLSAPKQRLPSSLRDWASSLSPSAAREAKERLSEAVVASDTSLLPNALGDLEAAPALWAAVVAFGSAEGADGDLLEAAMSEMGSASAPSPGEKAEEAAAAALRGLQPPPLLEDAQEALETLRNFSPSAYCGVGDPVSKLGDEDVLDVPLLRVFGEEWTLAHRVRAYALLLKPFLCASLSWEESDGLLPRAASSDLYDEHIPHLLQRQQSQDGSSYFYAAPAPSALANAASLSWLPSVPNLNSV